MRKPGRRFGKLGSFPEGKLHASDEGAIQFGIAADVENGVVVLDFGSSVVWLGLPPPVARQIGEALIKKADEVDAFPRALRAVPE